MYLFQNENYSKHVGFFFFYANNTYEYTKAFT